MNSLFAKLHNLPAYRDLCDDLLRQASADPGDPFRNIVLASTGLDCRPRQRILVLRDYNPGARILTAYTDIRTQKVREIRRNPEVGLLCWSPHYRLQIRIGAYAEIHHENEVSNAAWQNVSTEGRKLYSTNILPGTPFDRDRQTYQPPDGTDSELWQSNFALIRCGIHQMEALMLSRQGHLRARFSWEKESWHHEWLVP